MTYHHDPDDSYDPDDRAEAIEDAAVAAVQWAWIKAAAPQIVIVLVPALAAAAAFFGMIVMAYAALADLTGAMWWLALLYLALLTAAIVVRTIRSRRSNARIVRKTRAFDQSVPPPPTLAKLNSRGAWRSRAITAPAALLAAVHLAHDGWTSLLAAVGALVGWLGIDLAVLLSFPAWLRLHRIIAFSSSTPRNSPEI
jgi:hypothetical protein